MEKKLNLVEARVLGALIEKQITTPNYYPLSLTSLTMACNQKSNRSPVMSLSEQDVVRAVFALRDLHLAWEVAEAGARVTKYSHDISQQFDFSEEQIAVMCELMLRGPQTVGELRTRCERMCPLGDIESATAVVQSLVDYPETPLVVKLPKEPGRRECRYAHLLCGEPEIEFNSSVILQPEAAVVAVRAENERIAALENEVRQLREEVDRLAALENEVRQLREEVDRLAAQFAGFKDQFE